MISKYLTDGILIAAITIGGYLAAFRYEVAYLNHFGVPGFLAEVDFTVLLIAISTTVSFCILALSIYLGISAISESALKGTFFEKIIEDIGGLLAFAISLFFISVLIYQENFRKWWFVGLFFGCIVIFYIILPLLFPRFREWLLNKTYRNLERRKNQEKLNILYIAEHPLGSTLLILVFLWFSMNVGQTLGEASALTQKTYTMVSTEPSSVVLVAYKDFFIVVPMLDEKTFSKHFKLLSMQEIAEKSLVFSKQTIEK